METITNLSNPSTAPNPLTATLSLFRTNLQDKIMKSADAMPVERDALSCPGTLMIASSIAGVRRTR